MGRREKFLAFRNVPFLLILTNSSYIKDTFDSLKSHLQTKKFEVRRKSLKKILVHRGWKMSARHWYTQIENQIHPNNFY